MNTTKHTPGPWVVQHEGSQTIIVSRTAQESDSGGPTVSYIYNHESRQSKANARLISAAPELLEALQLALATLNRVHPPTSPFDSTQGTRDVINAAITKAKGN